MSQGKVYELVERIKEGWTGVVNVQSVTCVEVKEQVNQHIWGSQRISTVETAFEMSISNGRK